MTVQIDLPQPTYVGTTAQALAVFRNPGSNRPVDPSTITFVVTHGDGSEVTWEYGVNGLIRRAAQGKYKAPIALTVAGSWRLKVIGTGACDITDVTDPWVVIDPPA